MTRRNSMLNRTATLKLGTALAALTAFASPAFAQDEPAPAGYTE